MEAWLQVQLGCHLFFHTRGLRVGHFPRWRFSRPDLSGRRPVALGSKGARELSLKASANFRVNNLFRLFSLSFCEVHRPACRAR
jgi:hypothetical protein